MMSVQRISGLLAAVLVGVALGVSAQFESPVLLPNQAGEWIVDQPRVGRTVSRNIRVEIAGNGFFTVDPDGIQTVRPDIVQTNHFTVFDLLVKLDQDGQIALEYHYDESMGTHIIDSLNGESGWWYEARYSAGWFERNTHRMDHYLVKDETEVRFSIERASRLEKLYLAFEEEMARVVANDGKVILPRVTIEGPRREELVFEDIEVRAHDTRIDVLQPGTVTALDILLSLGEQGFLTQLGITWYEWIFTADPVDHYFVEYIKGGPIDAQAQGSCGFVYEVGYSSIPGFGGAHIHIPTDTRVILAPEYALWFWLCL